MPTQRDPEAVETAYLHRMTTLNDARVLEIGCGDGRLTWRYAGTTRHVIGIDSNREHLAVARRSCPPLLAARVAFLQATAVALPLRAELLDGAMLAWSL
jgi:ubiquinone/menaquinone biosynthesis C-methylase UbiE